MQSERVKRKKKALRKFRRVYDEYQYLCMEEYGDSFLILNDDQLEMIALEYALKGIKQQLKEERSCLNGMC